MKMRSRHVSLLMLPEASFHSSVSRLLALMSRLIFFQPIFITDNDAQGCPEQQAVINNMFKASTLMKSLCALVATLTLTHSQGKLLLMRCALMGRRRKSSAGWKQKEEGRRRRRRDVHFCGFSVFVPSHLATTWLHLSFQPSRSADSTSVSALSFHLSMDQVQEKKKKKKPQTSEFGKSFSPFCAFRHCWAITKQEQPLRHTQPHTYAHSQQAVGVEETKGVDNPIPNCKVSLPFGCTFFARRHESGFLSCSRHQGAAGTICHVDALGVPEDGAPGAHRVSIVVVPGSGVWVCPFISASPRRSRRRAVTAPNSYLTAYQRRRREGFHPDVKDV